MSSSRFRVSLLLAALCLFGFVTLRSQVIWLDDQQQDTAPVAPNVATNAASRASAAKKVFSKIYETNFWGADPAQAKFFSGSGSHDETVVIPYVSAVRSWIEREFPGRKPSALDLGCGDFNVGKQIRNVIGKYTAADVVPAVIEYNRKAFAGNDVEFQVIDIIEDPLPKSDVVFIRQVLQHLNNEQISQVLPKLKRFKCAVITEHIPKNDDFKPNVDIETGHVRYDVGSGTDFTVEPFNMAFKKKEILAEVPSNGGRIRTTAYRFS